MRKINIMLKAMSIILALSFITTQVSIAGAAGISSKDTLAPSLVSGDINPERKERVQEDIAKEIPGAIGNGKPLVDLMQGRLPPRIDLIPELEKKLRDAINAAIGMSVNNSANIPPLYQEKFESAKTNLVDMANNLTKRVYPYNAVVLGSEDYLLGFMVQEKVGLSIELIKELPIHLLAQLVFHECVSEHPKFAKLAKERGVIDRSDHKKIYVWIQSLIFGVGEVEELKRRLRSFIYEKLYEAQSVTTLKFPGTPALIYGSVGCEGLIAKIKANYSQPLPREELKYIRNIIQSKAPPAFFTDQEKEDLKKIAQALTGQRSFQDLNLKLKSPPYEGKPLHSIVVNLIDLEDEKIFRTNEGNFYQEITTYDEATGSLSIHIPKAFFEEYFQGENRSAITQTILHPLLEAIMGLSHQEAALALSFYNSDKTTAAQGKVNISDVHRLIIKEAKNMAINGDKAAIRQLNALLNPNFRFGLTGADIQALKARGRTIGSVDTIRIHSEELARIINGLARGPIGRFDTKIPISYIAPLPGMEKGEMPTQDILDEYSLVTNATIAAALAVVADGYVGKMTDLTENAEVKIIKDGADGLAKEEIQVIFNLSGYRIIVTVSEGGLRDAVEKSFLGGEVIGKKGLGVVSITGDVDVKNDNVEMGSMSKALQNSITLLKNVRTTIGDLAPYESFLETVGRVNEAQLRFRAEMFRANLIQALSEYPDKTFVLGIDTDIGSDQQNRLQEIFNAVRHIEEMENATHEKLFPNLVVRTNNAHGLVSDILKLKKEGKVDLSNVFVVGKNANVDGHAFDAIAGEGRAWITAVDDSHAGYDGYVPVFEAATLTIMAYLNAEGKADLDAIRDFYNAVAEEQIDPGMLQDMLTRRIIYILPKITNFETDELKKLYELAAQVHIAA